MTQEIQEGLPEIMPTAPKTFKQQRRIAGRLALPGRGAEPADIMVIATCPQEEELQEKQQMAYGKEFKIPAAYLKGPGGALLTDICIRNGFDLKQDGFYTALVKWLPEKAKRSRPHKEDIKFWKDVLFDEIRRVNPKIIVCLGKPVFDLLYPVTFAKKDLKGGFFRCEEFNCLLYPCDDLYQLVKRPELYGRFYLDFQEVARMTRQLSGEPRWQSVETHYQAITCMAELKALVNQWMVEQPSLMSVDCEWAGRNHVDGKLRSSQFAWKPGHAVYVRFMDDQGNYAFDASYLEVGMELGRYLNHPRVKYVGHHLAADFPWLNQVLGLVVYEKGYLDSEFALQCCDEFADLSLERLAITVTDLGRYDVDLLVWKKTSKQFHEDDGYGLVPDNILIPYACKDVDTVIRAVPWLERYLERENVKDYYFNILHPFVTDVFTEFAMQGLPMDVERMDELREIFHTSRRIMEGQICADIFQEARQILWQRMWAHNPEGAEVAFLNLENCARGDGDDDAAFNVLKHFAGVEDLDKWTALYEHYTGAPNFNIRSTPQMRRWLFDVKGYTPIKSTKKEALGIPATPWDRVVEMEPARQKLFEPAVDRQTLEILAAEHQDKLLDQLIELNAVGNLCKAFLKEADIDPETGEPVKENGLHFWLASDGRVHGQMSTTETGRPRSWKPNCLNWPSYTHPKIVSGVERALKRAFEEGVVTEEDAVYAYLQGKTIPPVRSCVTAPEGWMLVESDYATAELRGLAFISGDLDFIKLMTEPDTDFGFVHPSGKKDPEAVRLKYADNSPIDHEFRKPEFILAEVAKGEIKRTFTEADLLRDLEGNLIHPSADLHWGLAEHVRRKPREMLNKGVDRVAAKRGNFGAIYGIMAGTLERQIEQESGQKPEEGTGQAVLDALESSRAVAFGFLKELEETPINPGWLQAASGRKRRFALHPFSLGGISSRSRKSMISSQAREARNYYFQESVAATAARASVWLLREYRKRGMKARPMIVLYDSVVTLCPPHEREIVSVLHQRYMTDLNCWSYHGRIMNYPIDLEHCARWSTKSTQAERAKWESVPADPVPVDLT